MTLPKQIEAISRTTTKSERPKPVGVAPSDCCGPGKCCVGACLPFVGCAGACVPNLGQC